MPKEVADLLVEEGLIDDEGLQAARRRARRDGVGLVVALGREGRVTERQIVEVLVRRLQLQPVEPESVFIEMDAVREVSFDLAAAHCLLPLALERQAGRHVLRLAMADPLDREVIDEIEASTGCRVEAVVAPSSELVAAIEKAYRGIVTQVIPRGREARHPTSGAGPEAAPAAEPAVEEAPAVTRLDALLLVLREKGLVSDEELRDALDRLSRGR